MLETHFNKNGLCDGFVEWDLVNDDGKPDNQGEYVYFRNIWRHPNSNGLGKKLGKIVLNKCPTAKWAYWKRKRRFFNYKDIQIEREQKMVQVSKRRLLQCLNGY